MSRIGVVQVSIIPCAVLWKRFPTTKSRRASLPLIVGTPIFADAKAERIANLRASISMLSNPGKTERERYVVSELLLNLGVRFVDNDVQSVPARDEPPDVTFDVARFEVKELYDRERRRVDEYRRQLREADSATRCSELRPLTPLTSLVEILDPASAMGSEHAERYAPALVESLDLLLYHNLVDVIGLRVGSRSLLSYARGNQGAVS